METEVCGSPIELTETIVTPDEATIPRSPQNRKEESRRKKRASPEMFGRITRASAKKKCNKHGSISRPRRSDRLRYPGNAANESLVERVVREITLIESDKEDEPNTDEVRKANPAEILRDLEEKMNLLFHRLDTHQSILEDLESQVKRLCRSTNPADARYKSLYIASQKKVDSLRDENNQLSLKLQTVLGQDEISTRRVPKEVALPRNSGEISKL